MNDKPIEKEKLTSAISDYTREELEQIIAIYFPEYLMTFAQENRIRYTDPDLHYKYALWQDRQDHIRAEEEKAEFIKWCEENGKDANDYQERQRWRNTQKRI